MFVIKLFLYLQVDLDNNRPKMKTKNLFKLTLLSIAVAGTFFVSSCGKDDNPPANNGGGTTTTTEDYITFNGRTVKKPKSVRRMISSGDTALEWNKNDTTVNVYHELRVAKTYSMAMGSDSDKGVSVTFRWGAELSSPSVLLDGGTYELKKESGKWVSYITNATGKDATHGNAVVTGISARLTWPE